MLCPPTFSAAPTLRGTRAMATLSRGCSWMAEFSAVGSFEMPSRLMLFLSQEYRFADLLAGMHMQFSVHGVNPVTVLARDGNLRGTIHDQEFARLDSVN